MDSERAPQVRVFQCIAKDGKPFGKAAIRAKNILSLKETTRGVHVACAGGVSIVADVDFDDIADWWAEVIDPPYKKEASDGPARV